MEKPPTRVGRLGRALVDCFQTIALFLLGATIVWAAAHEYWLMLDVGQVRLHDILLLFIYLELNAIAARLNNRPRKTLDWMTPNEAWAAQVKSSNVALRT